MTTKLWQNREAAGDADKIVDRLVTTGTYINHKPFVRTPMQHIDHIDDGKCIGKTKLQTTPMIDYDPAINQR